MNSLGFIFIICLATANFLIIFFSLLGFTKAEFSFFFRSALGEFIRKTLYYKSQKSTSLMREGSYINFIRRASKQWLLFRSYCLNVLSITSLEVLYIWLKRVFLIHFIFISLAILALLSLLLSSDLTNQYVVFS